MVNWSSVFGINKGGAQVWQGNKGLEYLEQQNYAEQKRKQKEDAELTAELASVNYNGARDEDVPVLIDGYNDIKKTFAQYRQAKNSKERIQLANEIESKKAKFTQMVGASKAAIKTIGEFDKLRLNKADDLADDYVENLKGVKGTSTFDTTFQDKVEKLTANPFIPKFDETKYFTEATKPFVEKVPQSAPILRTTALGKQLVETKGERFNKKGFIERVIQDAAKNKGMLSTIKGYYPDANIKDAVLDYATKLADQAEKQYVIENKVVQSQNNPTAIELERLRIAQSREARENGKGGDASTVAITPKVFMTSEFDVNTGKTTSREGARFEKFGTVNPVAFKTPQLPSIYDVKKGKNVPNKVLDKPSVTGVGYALVKGNKYQLKASVIDGNGDEFIVNYNELPLKAKEDKFLKEVVGRLGSAPQAKPKPQSGSIPIVDSDEGYKAIPKGAKYKAPDGTIYIKK